MRSIRSLCGLPRGLVVGPLFLCLAALAGCESEPPSPLVVIEPEAPVEPHVVLPPASERLVGAFVHEATVAGVEGRWGLRWDGHTLTRSRDGVATGADECEVQSDGPQRVVLMCRSEHGPASRRPLVFDDGALVDELSRMRYAPDPTVVVPRHVATPTEGSSTPPP